jgi:hypothetical protein
MVSVNLRTTSRFCLGVNVPSTDFAFRHGMGFCRLDFSVARSRSEGLDRAADLRSVVVVGLAVEEVICGVRHFDNLPNHGTGHRGRETADRVHTMDEGCVG